MLLIFELKPRSHKTDFELILTFQTGPKNYFNAYVNFK